MATVHLVPREEALVLRRVRQPGPRAMRMHSFDDLAKPLIESPDAGAVYEVDPQEDTMQRFVLSLRGAFKRAGADATVRKLRGRNEVRAWINEPKPKARAKPQSNLRTQASMPTVKPGSNGRTPELAGVR